MDLIDQSGGVKLMKAGKKLTIMVALRRPTYLEDYVTNDEKLDKSILLNNDVKQ